MGRAARDGAGRRREAAVGIDGDSVAGAVVEREDTGRERPYGHGGGRGGNTSARHNYEDIAGLRSAGKDIPWHLRVDLSGSHEDQRRGDVVESHAHVVERSGQRYGAGLRRAGGEIRSVDRHQGSGRNRLPGGIAGRVDNACGVERGRHNRRRRSL